MSLFAKKIAIIDVERNQKYLQGRATARIDIDAFLAGRKLLEEEGFDYDDVVLNLGYSQGGHSGMWVNRLVAEGYRSDELPKIDYCIIGGGSYDMYSHYKKLTEENSDVNAKLEAAEKEIEQLRDRYLRTAAEFDNYKKRTLKEKAELLLNGSEKTVCAVLH